MVSVILRTPAPKAPSTQTTTLRPAHALHAQVYNLQQHGSRCSFFFVLRFCFCFLFSDMSSSQRVRTLLAAIRSRVRHGHLAVQPEATSAWSRLRHQTSCASRWMTVFLENMSILCRLRLETEIVSTAIQVSFFNDLVSLLDT